MYEQSYVILSYVRTAMSVYVLCRFFVCSSSVLVHGMREYISAIFPRAIVLSLPSIKNEILFTMPGCYHLQANLKRQHSQSQRVLGKTMCSGSNFAFQCTDNEISFLQGFFICAIIVSLFCMYQLILP